MRLQGCDGDGDRFARWVGKTWEQESTGLAGDRYMAGEALEVHTYAYTTTS